uniref:ArfGAP with RhoGAP domain, ankyrin repeat and PH domain 3 n=1 Tax=Scleropages formosus TaxID=113540 RepID=A0A8C9WR72_SCLFO
PRVPARRPGRGRTAPILSGWLDKLSPQGNYVFQKRYVKFDGRNLTYFGSEKEVYPKGVIPLAAIQMARAAKDYKFEVVTNHRTFVFRADNEALRNEWCDTLKSHVKEQLVFGRPRFGPGTHCQKTGYLELKGTKSKVYAAIVVEEVWLYKNEQCFKNGIGITVIEARGSTIREGKNKSFDLITPHKTFSFTAESERDKKDWMEALQESIAETLSDYEVAEKIWSNRSNKVCADCRAISPDWASINLCVVICKNCAGQHRSLGTMVSKVQSLKLDTSVWSNEIVQLFIMLGNDRANEFWSARLPPAEEIDCDATPEQRREFVALKYRQGRYRRPHPGFATQEELLKVSLQFRCIVTLALGPAGLEHLQVHLERGTFPVLHDRVIAFRVLSAVSLNRPLAVSRTGVGSAVRFSVCVPLPQAATPISCHCLLAREFERVGVLRYKAMLDPRQWKEGFFVLQKCNLFMCPGDDGAAEDIINLKRLQELSIASQNDNNEKRDILVLVEKGRTLYLQGMGRTDFSLWYADIQKAAGGKGNALKDQQLSRNDIPIIVDSCIAFITQYEISNKVQRLDRYKELIRGLPRVNRTTLAALISHLYRVQKCADLNQMCTKNLSLLFAPSLFQTDGKGEHEVKIIEDLIDNYLYVFEIDEEQQTQIELEVSLITTWKDTQLSQAGDLIIEVYLEKKTPDSCITLKVSPTMCAEELTNQVLYMRNVPAGEKDVWLTFEAIEDGELERPLHPKEKVLEQALQWCKMADPSSAYLLVKKVPRGEAIHVFTGYKSEVSKSGVLKCREEPPKLLQGNKFQERTFQIREHKLLLLKDKKSNKAEKEWHLKTLKIYLGVRKKLKAPSRYLCCSSESELWEWMISFLKAQHDDLQAPVLRRHSASDLSKQKFGTMPLVPIRGDESNSPLLSANQTLVKLSANRTLLMLPPPMKAQQDSFEERAETPEPLYEEVGDMGLQVPKPPESSFHGGAQRPLSLCQRKTASLDRMVGPNPVRLLPPASSLDALYVEEGRGPEAGVTLQPFPCRKPLGPGGSSQNLLLRELSTVFGRKAEDEDESADAPGGVA